MRELKFRAWDNINNTMLFRDPQYGCPYAMGGVCGDKDKTYMQYTGLKDKNGNEIYEDDILYYKEVTWHTIDTAKGVVRFGKVDLGSNERNYYQNGGTDNRLRGKNRRIRKSTRTNNRRC